MHFLQPDTGFSGSVTSAFSRWEQLDDYKCSAWMMVSEHDAEVHHVMHVMAFG